MRKGVRNFFYRTWAYPQKVRGKIIRRPISLPSYTQVPEYQLPETLHTLRIKGESAKSG